jgi:hypothetical protein
MARLGTHSKRSIVNGSFKLAAPLALALAAAACNAGGTSSVPPASELPTTSEHVAPNWEATRTAVAACPGSRVHLMQCDLLIEKTDGGRRGPDWGPSDFQAAYNLPLWNKGFGQTVGIVDAFDNPRVAWDLAGYRWHFRLPPANFHKYNQTGEQRNYPKGNVGWGGEIDLDVEMVSAICPHCAIDLIEANTNSPDNLYAAEKEAVALGAHIVSNSWGGDGGSPSRGSFDAPGVTYVASAGDGGYGMQDPADYDAVVSVGGTVLSEKGSTYSETVWIDTGGGCSYVTKPSWQHDPDCTKRTGNDVAAVASHVAEYDTYGYRGWSSAEGTSVSSPLIAGVFALAGNARRQYGGKSIWKLTSEKRKRNLHAISRGQTTGCPATLIGSYLCSAGTDQFGTYSGPAGWGTPNGIGAF